MARENVTMLRTAEPEHDSLTDAFYRKGVEEGLRIARMQRIELELGRILQELKECDDKDCYHIRIANTHLVDAFYRVVNHVKELSKKAKL